MFIILIVEDNSTYRELFKVIIDEGKFPGVIVEEPQNVKQAMEKADSFRTDLIFMDIGLLDEGLQVDPFNLYEISLARLSTKVEEEHNGLKGTLEGPWLVVQAPLVAHVALEVLLGGKLHARELLEDAADWGW